jgi:hypothetical protein
LPGLLQEIADVAGLKVALAIAAAHGGAKKKFPLDRVMEANPALYEQNWLVLTVGFDTALLICREVMPFGGVADIPAAKPWLAREFVKENQGKLSMSEMAFTLGYSERSIRRIKDELVKSGTGRADQ